MRTIGNILWIFLAGWWLSLSYVFAGLVSFIFVITIPFGVQAMKLAGYALWPFGRVVVHRANQDVGLSTLGNVLWFLLGGWWLALAHALAGLILMITIIGFPLGIGSLKMAGLALAPFGKQIVPLREAQTAGLATAVSIQALE